MKRPPFGAKTVTRETLEATARIIGPSSAAAAALADANTHNGPVVFWAHGNILWVEKRPKENPT